MKSKFLPILILLGALTPLRADPRLTSWFTVVSFLNPQGATISYTLTGGVTVN
jgi:hypothetical protein